MPKAAKQQSAGAVLQSFIEEYRINPFSLSKSLQVAYQSVTNIISGKTRITVQMALRLAQYFGNSPKFWLDAQYSSEINELSTNKKFIASIKKIPRAKKPTGKAAAKTVKKVTKAKAGKKKTNTLAGKRKKAAKVSGTKKARGRKTRR